MEKLTAALKDYLPYDHFLCTGYVRNAIVLLIKALGLQCGDEIILPAFTCISIPNAIKYPGCVPIYVDSENDGIALSAKAVEKALTVRTKGIYVIHPYGHIADIEAICGFAKAKGLFVIEDCAHTLLFSYKQKKLGTYGDFVLLGFTKFMYGIQGGAVGTNDSAVYRRISSLYEDLRHRKWFYMPPLSYYVQRLLGSWWERGAGIIPLKILHAIDWVFSHIQEDRYDNAILMGETVLHGWLEAQIIKQLRDIPRRNQHSMYPRFVEWVCHYADHIPLRQSNDDTLPMHCGALVNDPRLNALSFRSWPPIHPLGKYPRADKLFSNFRLFVRDPKWWKI
jgi:hypothetical protein